MTGNRSQIRLTLLMLVAVAMSSVAVNACQAAVRLDEPENDDRVFSVRCRLSVEGTIPPPDMQPGEPLSLKVDGRFSYLERRLPPAGADAESLRSLRHYQLAEADIDVGGRKTVSRLPESQQLIVAEARRSEVRSWAVRSRMTTDTQQLLRVPGDSIALLGILPEGDVEAGTAFEPPAWVLPTLTGIEAVSKNSLTCRISKVDSEYAVIELNGTIEGAIYGALTNITLTGQVAWDLNRQHIRQARIVQTEKRQAGPVNPRMEVTATMYVDRQISTVQGPLTDRLVDTVPILAGADQLALWFDSPWQARFAFGRQWHVFHQTGQVAVLRMIENGSLVAQCNVSPVPTVPPGTQTSATEFVDDVRRALGDNLQQVSGVDTLNGEGGLRLMRVRASGSTRDVPMQWIYYLATAPDGRQIAFSFSIEARLLKQLANQDVFLVESTEFLPQSATAAAAPAETQEPERR